MEALSKSRMAISATAVLTIALLAPPAYTTKKQSVANRQRAQMDVDKYAPIAHWQALRAVLRKKFCSK
jgi:hypothetical protein